MLKKVSRCAGNNTYSMAVRAAQAVPAKIVLGRCTRTVSKHTMRRLEISHQKCRSLHPENLEHHVIITAPMFIMLPCSHQFKAGWLSANPRTGWFMYAMTGNLHNQKSVYCNRHSIAPDGCVNNPEL